MKILIVDDEPLVLTLATSILKRSGYDVVCAASGRTALELCEQLKEEIGLVLSDVRMPEMNGIELAECIANFDHPVPVVLMSGFSREGPLISGLIKKGRMETYRFLPKPFAAKDLLRIVSTALEESL